MTLYLSKVLLGISGLLVNSSPFSGGIALAADFE